MSLNQFTNLLLDVGLKLDKYDVNKVFRYFDVNSNGMMSRDEYTLIMKLSDYEMDLVTQLIRYKLFMLTDKSRSISTSRPTESTMLGQSENTTSILSNQQSSGVLTMNQDHGTIVSPLETPLQLMDSINGNNNSTTTKLSENLLLKQVFEYVNTKIDNILSYDECRDLICNKLDIYLVEDEISKVMKSMDVNNDGRVDESDFISFMSKFSNSIKSSVIPITFSGNNPNNFISHSIKSWDYRKDIVVKKALRLFEILQIFRRWLSRSISTIPSSGLLSAGGEATGDLLVQANINLQDHQPWKELKKRYEYVTKQKFPNVLTPTSLSFMLSSKLSINLSYHELKEMIFIISSASLFETQGVNNSVNMNNLALNSLKRSDCVQYKDLNLFMVSRCRAYGELLVVLSHSENGVLRELLRSYRRHINMLSGFATITNNGPSTQPQPEEDNYYLLLRQYVGIIQNIGKPVPPVNVSNVTEANKSHISDIVSISQFKLGLDSIYPRLSSSNSSTIVASSPLETADLSNSNANTSANNKSIYYLSYEEWTLLSMLSGSDVVNDSTGYGVKIFELLNNLVNLIATGGLTSSSNSNVNNLKGSNTASLIYDEKTLFELICKDLLRMIQEESKIPPSSIKPNTSKDTKPFDYKLAFQLFDENKDGAISTEEFKNILIRLQLFDDIFDLANNVSVNVPNSSGTQEVMLSDRLISQLLLRFDPSKKGYITYEDFLQFVNVHKYLLDDVSTGKDSKKGQASNDEDDEDDDLGLYGLMKQVR